MCFIVRILTDYSCDDSDICSVNSDDDTVALTTNTQASLLVNASERRHSCVSVCVSNACSSLSKIDKEMTYILCDVSTAPLHSAKVIYMFFGPIK